MKKTILIIMLILCLPLAYSLYGGETWKYHFDKCEELKVNITGTEDIIEGEYIILNNCTRNDTNYYICYCEDDYDFNVTFKINTINNYTIDFSYAFSVVIEEQQSSGGGGSSSRRKTKECIPDWNCTDWTNCQPNSRATRNCTDLNNCSKEKPSEERICYYYILKEEKIDSPIEELKEEIIKEETDTYIEELEDKEGIIGIAIVLSIVFIGLIIFLAIVNRKKKKKEEENESRL